MLSLLNVTFLIVKRCLHFWKDLFIHLRYAMCRSCGVLYHNSHIVAVIGYKGKKLKMNVRKSKIYLPLLVVLVKYWKLDSGVWTARVYLSSLSTSIFMFSLCVNGRKIHRVACRSRQTHTHCISDKTEVSFTPMLVVL